MLLFFGAPDRPLQPGGDSALEGFPLRLSRPHVEGILGEETRWTGRSDSDRYEGRRHQQKGRPHGDCCELPALGAVTGMPSQQKACGECAPTQRSEATRCAREWSSIEGVYGRPP